MHLSKGSKTGPIISLHISSVMNVRSWFIYLIQRKRSVRTSNKVVLSKILFAQAILERWWFLLKLLWSTNIFTVSFIRSQSTYIPTVEYRSVCPLTGTGTPHPSIPSPARYPFISITHSKPLMSSGSWLTPVTTDIIFIIFIGVNIYPWPRKGGLQLISEPNYFIRVTIYPAALAEVTIYPARFTAMFWLVSMPLFTLGHSACFCHSLANLKKNSYASLQIFFH